MLARGIYPASTTPFLPSGQIDFISLARLVAGYEAAGCQGVVVSGTNGEGPNLAAVEKRDLVREAVKFKGKLKVILGISTPSLEEAKWLVAQAGKAGADAILLLPPGYFRRATERGVADWLLAVLDASPIPVILYHYPTSNGVGLPLSLMDELVAHPKFAGIKNSENDPALLSFFRAKTTENHALFVGDERLIPQALAAGWSGSISGAGNVIAPWLVRLVNEFGTESGTELEKLLMPVIEKLRSVPNPETYKAVQEKLGLIDCKNPRLPLLPADPEGVLAVLKGNLGIG